MHKVPSQDLFLKNRIFSDSIQKNSSCKAKDHAAAVFGKFILPGKGTVLQIAVAHGSGERQHIPDVAHTGQIHDAALKAQTEACVTGGAVLP